MSTLVLFARAPERGRVKTRLAQSIGDDAALALYDAMLEDCLTAASIAMNHHGGSLILAIAGPVDHPRLVELAAAHGAERVAQPDGDLGLRMAHFVDRYLSRGPVCLIGSDAPSLSSTQIASAFEALRMHEVVVGPGIDGGYWLIGARRAIPELMSDMPWSTDRLLGATLERLAGRSAALLEFYYDVDDEGDLGLLKKHLAIAHPQVAHRTRRALAGLS